MKLSLDALKERAGATASMDLLATISGGTENACHQVPLNHQYGGAALLAAYIVEGVSWLFGVEKAK